MKSLWRTPLFWIVGSGTGKGIGLVLSLARRNSCDLLSTVPEDLRNFPSQHFMY